MFTDIMVDTETTGTDPAHTNLIQLAAVKFNLETREVGNEFFDQALLPAPHRFWDEGARDFWMKMPDTYQSFVSRAKPPEEVLKYFYAWVVKDQPEDLGYRFWAKPVTFDWSFLASYYRQYDMPMPFHYRLARDVNSYSAGLRGHPAHVSLDEQIPFEGTEHNALWDCLHQIKVVFHAQDQYEANR